MTDINTSFAKNRLKTKKRVGRGLAGKGGKTAGRGTKGQKSRSGANRKIPTWFEGGQTPIIRKLAKKRGFKRTTIKPITITSDLINRFYHDGEAVSPKTLNEKKIVHTSDLKTPIKVVLKSPLKVKVSFEFVKTSKSISPKT